MKQKLLFKTALLLVALVGGVSASWADNNPIEIPQALGTYINFGTTKSQSGDVASGVNLSNCQTDNPEVSSNYYGIGNTGTSSVATFKIYVKTAGDYIFNFKTGAQNCSAVLNLVLTDDSKSEGDVGYTVWSKIDENGEKVVSNRDWNMGSGHYFLIPGLAVGNYTMKVSVYSKEGSYAGNWGYFAFNSSNAFDGATWPTSSSMVNLTNDGIYACYGGSASYDGSDNVGSIKSGACAEYIVKNTSASDHYLLHMGMKFHNAGNLVLSITDLLTGTVEVNQTYPVWPYGNYDDFVFPILNNLTTGVKKMRLEFREAGTNSDGYIVNYKNVYFSTYTSLASEYQALPIKKTANLNLSIWPISGNPRYQSSNQNLGYIYNNNYAFFYVYNANETTQYNFIGSYDRNTANSRLKVSVIDVATNNSEAEGTFDLGEYNRTYTELMYTLPGTVTGGLKLVRFDFLNPTESPSNVNWLFNIKDVSFIRSLNEAYDYTPVVASGVDVVLTRSIPANKWSTIVLPFDIASSDITTIFGAGASVAELTSSSNETTLAFSTTLTDSKMKANQPYAIKVASNFTSKTISGVTIADATPTQSLTKWNFVGTYSSANIPADSYFFSSNQLWKAEDGTNTIKPFRAYFTPKEPSARELSFVIDDAETTAIGTMKVDGTMETVADGKVYNLNGQRVNKPVKGLYVINGKKVVIK